MAEYRAEEIAAAAGVTLALVRSYQSKGLLPPPRHVGRAALYGEHHLERLRRIEALKSRGHSLRSIAEQLESGAVGRAPDTGERLGLRDVAERSGVPVEMLRSFEASGLLRPRPGPEGASFTHADVRAVQCLLLLVGAGIPFERFLDVAEPQLRAADAVASGALDLFDRHVAPRLEGSEPGRRAEALGAMAAAVGELAAYLVERQVLVQGELAAPPFVTSA